MLLTVSSLHCQHVSSVGQSMVEYIPVCDGRSADKGMHALQNGNGETEIGSVYDIASQTFTPFHFSTNAFCAGHSVAQDGTLIIAGN